MNCYTANAWLGFVHVAKDGDRAATREEVQS